MLEKAVELYNLNEYRKSKTIFQQVLDTDPQNEMAQNYLKLISETLELEMKSQVTIDSPYYPIYTRFMEGADREFKRNNFEASLSYLKEVLNLFPLSKPGQKFRLKILYKTDPAKFKEVLAGYIQNGNDYLNKGQYKFAKNEFATVKEIAPDFPGIDGLIASCIPKPKAAIAEIEKQYNTGLLFYQQGKFFEAETTWRKVIELDNSPDSNPYYAKAYLNMAKARQKLGGGQVAGIQTSSANTEQEKKIKKAYYMGVAYYTQGQYQKAIDEWQKVLSIDRNNVLAINNIQKAKKKLEYAK